MKRLCTVCVGIAVLLAGTQSSLAQTDIRLDDARSLGPWLNENLDRTWSVSSRGIPRSALSDSDRYLLRRSSLLPTNAKPSDSDRPYASGNDYFTYTGKVAGVHRDDGPQRGTVSLAFRSASGDARDAFTADFEGIPVLVDMDRGRVSGKYVELGNLQQTDLAFYDTRWMLRASEFYSRNGNYYSQYLLGRLDVANQGESNQEDGAHGRIDVVEVSFSGGNYNIDTLFVGAFEAAKE